MSETNEKTEKKVVLTQDQYQALLGRIDKMEEKVGQSPDLEAMRPTFHTCTVMFFNDLPIVQFLDMKMEAVGQPNGVTTYKAADNIEFLVLEGAEKKPFKANYVGLIESATRYTAIITKRDPRKIEKIQGSMASFVDSSPTDPIGAVGSRPVDFRSEKVKLVQTLLKETVTVKFIDGPLADQEIVVDSECLNK